MDENRQHVNERFKSSYKEEYHSDTFISVINITIILYNVYKYNILNINILINT